jgi:hypothetical protein
MVLSAGSDSTNLRERLQTIRSRDKVQAQALVSLISSAS